MQQKKFATLLKTLFSQERNDMRYIEIDELRKLQLDIMQTIHDFCTKNNIRYSISGGTLLGAVRHKGYIPWDDDIDCMMPRPDYEKFVATFNENNDSPLKVFSSYNDRNFFQPFAKVVNTKTRLIEHEDRSQPNLGVYVDIFPIDGLPNDEDEREQYWNMIAKKKNFSTVIYSKINEKEHGLKKIARKILFCLFRPFSANWYAKKLHRLGIKNSFEASKFVANSIFGYHTKEQMPKSIFDDFVLLDFEDRKFSAVKDYNTYLSNLFGDYMQLPPKEKQVSKHDFEVYWR